MVQIFDFARRSPEKSWKSHGILHPVTVAALVTIVAVVVVLVVAVAVAFAAADAAVAAALNMLLTWQ